MTYFDQRINQLIIGTGQTSKNLDGGSHACGVEVAATLALIPGLDLHGACTFTHTRDPDGNELVCRRKHISSFDVNYR